MLLVNSSDDFYSSDECSSFGGARYNGIEAEFSDLLEKAGVDTVKELRTRNAASLHARLIEINAQDNYAGRAPHLNEVESWIEQAGQLDPKVTHS